MAHALKQNHNHKRHETRCRECNRNLPKQAYKACCASCIKQELGTSTPSIHFKREKVAA